MIDLTSIASTADVRHAPVTAVLMHGFGGSERDLAALGAQLSLPWVSLRGPFPVSGAGHAWFPIVVPGDPAEEPLDAVTRMLWGWIDENLGTDAVIVPVGFSQGGVMASQLVRTRPDRVAATGILGGFVQAAAQAGDASLRERRAPIFWARGADDRVITPAAVARTETWMAQHAADGVRIYPGLGHGIDGRVLRDLRAFLSPVVAGARGQADASV